MNTQQYKERRINPRFSPDSQSYMILSIDFGQGYLKGVSLNNISRGGIGIQVIAENLFTNFIFDQEVTLYFSKINRGKKVDLLTVKGKIRWSHYNLTQDITTLGIEFENLPQEKHKEIENIMRKNTYYIT